MRMLMARLTLMVLVCLLLSGATLSAQDGLPPIISPENAAQLKQIEQIEGGTRYGDIAWSPEGHTLAITQGNQIAFYDVATMELLPETVILDESYDVSDLVFSHDGGTLYYGMWFSDEAFGLWSYDLRSRRQQELYHVASDRPSHYTDLTLSFDGDTLTVIHLNRMQSYQISTGELFQLAGVTQSADSPNGLWHVNVFAGTITTLQTSTDLAVALALDSSTIELQYGPVDTLVTWDGTYFVAAQQGRHAQVEFWAFDYLADVCSGLCQIRAYEPSFALAESESYYPAEMAINSDDSLLAVTYEGQTDGRSYRKIIVWDIATQTELTTLVRAQSPRPDHFVDVAFSADRRYLASISWNGIVQIYAVAESAE